MFIFYFEVYFFLGINIGVFVLNGISDAFSSSLFQAQTCESQRCVWYNASDCWALCSAWWHSGTWSTGALFPHSQRTGSPCSHSHDTRTCKRFKLGHNYEGITLHRPEVVWVRRPYASEQNELIRDLQQWIKGTLFHDHAFKGLIIWYAYEEFHRKTG